MISVIILTRNEERDLPRCFNSLDWCDDVHVVDSGSSDETIKIARDFGGRIYENRFTSFGTQRNWALDNCDIRHQWILFLDADEVANRDFVKAMSATVHGEPDSTAGFYCCWRLI